MKVLARLLPLLLTTPLAWAQLGDRSGDAAQRPPPAEWNIPPAPILGPQEAVNSFVLPPGFRIELVASEPLVKDPIVVKFDGQGRMWVIELPAYNHEIFERLPHFLEGTDLDSLEPRIGRVVVLEDSTGDGTMDRRTVFADNLHLPRAIGFAGDGVLIGDPPHLWFFRDRNGDGKADEKFELADDWGTPEVMQSGPNGLIYGIDNWIHSAHYGFRLRYEQGEWRREPTLRRGQWGISQDDYGRFYFTRNSDKLRSDLLPAHYAVRNPNVPDFPAANFNVALSQTTWPIRPSSGANRGYREGQLHEDGRLASFTGAAASVIYRGHNFPDSFYGNAFIPEPVANMVKRAVLVENDGLMRALNAYEGKEFLSSLDERFRPVWLENGPDGALYIADMYRGIIEGYQFITSYLRNEILARGLNRPLYGMGRIYRVVYDGKPTETENPDFASRPGAELAGYLRHPSGWWRDMAQQSLVDRGDRSAERPLLEMLNKEMDPVGRLHALWTLDGLNLADPEVVAGALSDPSPKVRAAAIRISERFLSDPGNELLWKGLEARAEDEAGEVAVQLALSLGESDSPRAASLLRRVALRGSHLFLESAVLSSLHGRELEFIESLLKDPEFAGSGRFSGTLLLPGLAAAVVRENDPVRLGRLGELTGGTSEDWVQLAILNGVRSGLPRGRAAGPVHVTPETFAALGASPHLGIQRRAQEIAQQANRLRQIPPEQRVIPLTDEQTLLMQRGRGNYPLCAGCHSGDGLGIEGMAPPLVGSKWVNGPEELLARILLQGMEGNPRYPSGMPQVAVFTDEQIASVMTFIRRSWGHTASPVDPETVARVRQETAGRGTAWTEEELEQLRSASGR